MNILFIEVLIRLTSERAFLYQFDLYKQFFFCCISEWNIKALSVHIFIFFQLVTLICFLFFYLNKILFFPNASKVWKALPFCDYIRGKVEMRVTWVWHAWFFSDATWVIVCNYICEWNLLLRGIFFISYSSKRVHNNMNKAFGKIYCVWKFFCLLHYL